MWEAAGELLKGGQMQIITFVGGLILLILGVSRKFKIVPDQRKWLNRAGLVLLLSSLALWMFKEVFPYVH